MKLRQRFLLLSLVLHAALFAAFFLRRSRPEPTPQALMVDLAPPPEEKAAPAPATPSVNTASPVKPSPLPLSALSPVHKTNLHALRLGDVEAPAPEPDAFSPYQASQDVLKSASPEESGALAWVYRKTQYTVGYPEAFVHHDITGQTEARLVFDRSGKIRPDLLRVRSDSPYLRVYVYRALERAFTAESVPANLVRWPDTFEVFCYVKFSFSGTETTVTAAAPIVGNKLYFQRMRLKSASEKLAWNLGPLHGFFLAPAVGVDMMWFAKKYDEHKHPLRTKSEEDDLAPYRNDPLFADGNG